MSGATALTLCGVALLALQIASSQDLGDSSLLNLCNGNADFAGRLYRAVSSRTDDNIALSPFGLSMALAALASGSNGATQQQLLKAIGLTSLEPQQIPGLFQNLRSTITESEAFPLKQGIAILPSQMFSVAPSYLNLVQNQFGGNASSLMYTVPQEAQDTINSWAQTQTGDRVKDVVSNLDTQTQLLLVSVMCYQTRFSPAFNASLTEEERFYVDKYHIVHVPMMFRSGKFHLAYDSSLHLGILKLPMSDGAAMLVLFPDENISITSVEEEISGARFQGWLRQLKRTKLEVQLPRFLLERSYSLKHVLTQLEIKDVFQDTADLSLVSTEKGLQLTQVYHKAAITADESNGAAAGATATFTSLPPRLTINRPFLFIIYHQNTSSILSMGRVVDPSRT